MSSDVNIQIGLVQIQLLRGDITQIAVDAIVNAANSGLVGGGGVDGAVHRAGGSGIMDELDEIRTRIGGCQTGSAVATGAGKLPAKFVFHAVGPRYRNGSSGEAAALTSCYRTCLDLALKRGVQTISFPSISTGIYGYPIEEAAELALQTIADWLRDHPNSLQVVKLVQFREHDHEIYREAARHLRGNLSAETHG